MEKITKNPFSELLEKENRNCFWNVSVHRNCPEPSQMHVEDVQNIDILSFWKAFYDRHCAPYKWNFAVFGIVAIFSVYVSIIKRDIDKCIISNSIKSDTIIESTCLYMYT